MPTAKPAPHPSGTARTETLFAVSVALGFALVCAFATSYHEMWRDELQAWLIARDSRSLRELVGHVHYEAHPTLWYLLLYGITRVTHHAAAMQALHVAIGAGSAFLFAKFAPFPRWMRVLFCFGYYSIYEYGVIARNYSLGAFFLFAAAAAFPWRRTRPVVLGLLLALAAQTNTIALLVAATMAGTVLVEPLISTDRRARTAPALTTFLITVAGSLVALFTALPPADSGFAEPLAFAWTRLRAERVLGTLAKAVLPIPDGRALWGELWLETVSHHVAPLLALVLFALLVPYFLRRKLAAVMFMAGTSVMFFFFFTKLDGQLRHHGFLFLNLVLALWIGEIVTREARARGLPAVARASSVKAFTAVAGSVLALHAIVAAISVRQEVALRFSAARGAAAMLVESGLDRLPMVGDGDWALPPVLGYLPQRTVYYVRGERFGSFVRLDRARKDLEITDETVLDAARSLGRAERSAVAVVINHMPPAFAVAGAEEVGCIAADVVWVESYCIYRLPPPADVANR